jgi:hypothetical protein
MPRQIALCMECNALRLVEEMGRYKDGVMSVAKTSQDDKPPK